jgi:uncharacterized membrane protein
MNEHGTRSGKIPPVGARRSAPRLLRARSGADFPIADDSLRRWALIFTAAILAAILMTPLLAAQGRYEAFAFYAAFRSFCHQQVERSWQLGMQPLPVCVRCLGFYGGAFVAAALGMRFSKQRLLFALAAALLSWAVELAGQPVPSAVRFASGLLLGGVLVAAIAEKSSGFLPRPNHLSPRGATHKPC